MSVSYGKSSSWPYPLHDDVIKWKHFPRNWPFVREIHRSPVNFPHKGQWRGALMFSLIYAWINDWVNNREAGDLRRQHGHYDVIVMFVSKSFPYHKMSPIPQNCIQPISIRCRPLYRANIGMLISKWHIQLCFADVKWNIYPSSKWSTSFRQRNSIA